MKENCKIIFVSGGLGRQGKSTHSITFSQYAKIPLITNDKNNSTKELYKDIKNIDIQTLGLESSLDFLDNTKSWVFDAGGFEEIRIPQIIHKAQKVVVVFFYQSTSDFMEFYKGLKRLESKINGQEIIILLNNTDKDCIAEAEDLIKTSFPTYPLFTVNRSRYFWRLSDISKTVFDIMDEGGLDRRNLIRAGIITQLEAFYKYLIN